MNSDNKHGYDLASRPKMCEFVAMSKKQSNKSAFMTQAETLSHGMQTLAKYAEELHEETKNKIEAIHRMDREAAAWRYLSKLMLESYGDCWKLPMYCLDRAFKIANGEIEP